VVEGNDEQFAVNVTSALLEGYHNPRRNLLITITLTSDHKKCTDFVLRDGSKVLCSKVFTDKDAAWLKPNNECTDFIVYGAAEVDGERNVATGAVREALLAGRHNPRRCLLESLLLSSDHKRCTDFVLVRAVGFVCSKDLTSADVLWLERTAGVKRGCFFRAARAAAGDDVSKTELPWEPMARYNAMARHMRTQRGSKSAEHLANLRRSDPTINLSGWLDWRALHEAAEATWLTKLQHQAEINRALAGHRVATRQDAARRAAAAVRCPGSAPKHGMWGGVSPCAAQDVSKPLAKPTPTKPTPVVVKANGGYGREERRSADSVISFLDEPFSKPISKAAEPKSPSTIVDGLDGLAGVTAGWSLDKGGFGSVSYRDAVKGAGGRDKVKAMSYAHVVKGVGNAQKAAGHGGEAATSSAPSSAESSEPEARDDTSNEEDVVWFDGVALVKSADGASGYSSA